MLKLTKIHTCNYIIIFRCHLRVSPNIFSYRIIPIRIIKLYFRHIYEYDLFIIFNQCIFQSCSLSYTLLKVNNIIEVILPLTLYWLYLQNNLNCMLEKIACHQTFWYQTCICFTHQGEKLYKIILKCALLRAIFYHDYLENKI